MNGQKQLTLFFKGTNTWPRESEGKWNFLFELHFELYLHVGKDFVEHPGNDKYMKLISQIVSCV